MEYWVYDLEVYKNYFCGVFIQVDTQEKLTFEFHEHADELEKLNDFIFNGAKKTLIGFNNKGYDNLVLNYVLSIVPPTNHDIYATGADIIDNGTEAKNYWDLWKCINFLSFDVFCVPKKERGLKERACQLFWPSIQDLPIDPHANVPVDQFENMLKYCENDVLITLEEYKNVAGLIQVRENLCNEFHVDVISDHDAGVTEKIFTKLLVTSMKMRKYKIVDTIAYPAKINLADCIPDHISFQTSYLQEFLDSIKKVTIDVDEKFTRELSFGGLSFTFGKGGLHSCDPPRRLNSTKTHILLDVDVTSYYPAIMINENLEPPHLKGFFRPILEKLRDMRVNAKQAKNSLMSDGLKIPLNSSFGKTGNHYSIMYSPQVNLSVTLIGQLNMLLLVEQFLNQGIEVLSINTDGVLLRVSIVDKKIVHNVCKQWEELTNYQLEYTTYRTYAARDINNYIAETFDGEIKRKGIFKEKQRSMPDIYAYTLEQYFLKNIPVSVVIMTCYDFKKFLNYRHVGYSTSLYLDDVELPEKTIRFYHTKTPNILQTKRELTDKERRSRKNPDITETTTKIAENLKPINKIENWVIPKDLDKEYYINHVLDIIFSIVPQTSIVMKKLTR